MFTSVRVGPNSCPLKLRCRTTPSSFQDLLVHPTLYHNNNYGRNLLHKIVVWEKKLNYNQDTLYETLTTKSGNNGLNRGPSFYLTSFF